MKIIKDLEQGSADWHAGRLECVTGSKAKRVFGTKEARTGLIAELISEKLTEQTHLVKQTASMERGNQEEVFARKEFEKRTGKKVEVVGICISDKYDWLKVSPDGLIADTVGDYTEALEIKCPDSKNAILYKIENMIDPIETGVMSITKKLERSFKSSAPFLGIPSEYKWQVIQYFLVNEKLQTLHFAIYDPRFIDEDAKLYVVQLHRDNEILQDAIKYAWDELANFRADWLNWSEIINPTKF